MSLEEESSGQNYYLHTHHRSSSCTKPGDPLHPASAYELESLRSNTARNLLQVLSTNPRARKEERVAQLRALRSLSSEVSKALGAQRHGFGLDLFQRPGLSWGQKPHGTRRQKWKLRTARPRAANKLPSNHASIDGT